MNCDPKALAQASRCYCFPKNVNQSVMVYLLCQWANHLTPQNQFYWLPASKLVEWSDPAHPAGIVTNLATFNATANIPNVLTINAVNRGITAIGGLSHLPALTQLLLDQNAISGALDITGCNFLFKLTLSVTNITSVDCTGHLLLTYLDVSFSLVTSIGDLTGIVLNNFSGSGSNLTSLSFPSGVNIIAPFVFNVFNCPFLTSIDFGPASSFNAGDPQVFGNPLLTSVTIGAPIWGNAGSGCFINFSNCALNANSVNTILHSCIGQGFSGAGPDEIDLEIGTNSPPTIGPPNGIADKATLQGTGTTVLTN
jgi:hypothetical protein